MVQRGEKGTFATQAFPSAAETRCWSEACAEREEAGAGPEAEPEARAAEPEAALCNCLGFGSKNSAVVLGAVLLAAGALATKPAARAA